VRVIIENSQLILFGVAFLSEQVKEYAKQQIEEAMKTANDR
jgi:hypothetical protein